MRLCVCMCIYICPRARLILLFYERQFNFFFRVEEFLSFRENRARARARREASTLQTASVIIIIITTTNYYCYSHCYSFAIFSYLRLF